MEGGEKMFRTKGFTLIELLIVVAIIGILAAIAIPNFLNAQVRAKVSRAESEMRNIATALETYYIDNNAYPPSSDWFGAFPAPGADKVDSNEPDDEGNFYGQVSYMLTTPVAHLPSLPSDPFFNAGDSMKNVYRYSTNVASCWIMCSNGPDNQGTPGNNDDGYPDLGPESAYIGNYCDLALALREDGGDMNNMTYDPTNGTTSNGDVWRVGP